jgi:hypothetical protein
LLGTVGVAVPDVVPGAVELDCAIAGAPANAASRARDAIVVTCFMIVFST